LELSFPRSSSRLHLPTGGTCTKVPWVFAPRLALSASLFPLQVTITVTSYCPLDFITTSLILKDLPLLQRRQVHVSAFRFSLSGANCLSSFHPLSFPNVVRGTSKSSSTTRKSTPSNCYLHINSLCSTFVLLFTISATGTYLLRLPTRYHWLEHRPQTDRWPTNYAAFVYLPSLSFQDGIGLNRALHPQDIPRLRYSCFASSYTRAVVPRDSRCTTSLQLPCHSSSPSNPNQLLYGS